MFANRWEKIMSETGCTEAQARTASSALAKVGDAKGTALTLPRPVQVYIGDRLAKAAADVLEAE